MSANEGKNIFTLGTYLMDCGGDAGSYIDREVGRGVNRYEVVECMD